MRHTLANGLLSDQKITSTYFARLIQDNQTPELNKVSELLCERMTLFLRTVYKADAQLAGDCAQNAFEKVYIGVKDGQIKDLDNIFGYCINSVKNEYLMSQRSAERSKEFDPEEAVLQGYIQPPDIFDVLNNEDREIALKKCVELLKEKRRDLFLRILALINTSETEAAAKLKMTHAQYRTKKSRIVASLKICVGQKLGN